MAWSGGTFSRVEDFTADAANGIPISSVNMDSEMDNLAAGINSCLHLGGTNSPTANVDWGGFKITDIADATTRTGVPAVKQLQDSGLTYVASDTGSANAYAIAPSPAITAYAAGQRFQFVPANKNTGAATLAVSGLTAKNIKMLDGTDPPRNAVHTSQIADVMYNGTSFILLNPAAPFIGAFCSTIGGAAQAVVTATPTAITFGSEAYDTDAFHDTGSNTSRLTIPAGVTYARISAGAIFSMGATADLYAQLRIYKNGAVEYIAGAMHTSTSTADNSTFVSITSPVLAVTATHYYEVYVEHNKGSDADVNAFFGIEIIR